MSGWGQRAWGFNQWGGAPATVVYLGPVWGARGWGEEAWGDNGISTVGTAAVGGQLNMIVTANTVTGTYNFGCAVFYIQD